MGHNLTLGKLLIKPSTWARLVLTDHCGMDNSAPRRTVTVAEGVCDHVPQQQSPPSLPARHRQATFSLTGGVAARGPGLALTFDRGVAQTVF